MKITALFTFLFCAVFSSLMAQTPETPRQQIHAENLAVNSARHDQLELEEKRLRLVEAIAEGDLESATIMRDEVLDTMERQLESVKIWMTNHREELKDTGFRQSVTTSFTRLESLKNSIRDLDLKRADREQAEKASSWIQEFGKLSAKFL